MKGLERLQLNPSNSNISRRPSATIAVARSVCLGVQRLPATENDEHASKFGTHARRLAARTRSSISLNLLQAPAADGIFAERDGDSMDPNGSIQPSLTIARLFAEPVAAFEARGPIDPRVLAPEEAA